MSTRTAALIARVCFAGSAFLACVAFGMLLAIAASGPAPAQSAINSLLVTPPGIRVDPLVTYGRFRVHGGAKGGTYKVLAVPLMPHETKYTDVCADLLYAPHKVTLKPNQSRPVRVMFTKPYSGSPERCRIRFEAVEPPGHSDTPKALSGNRTGAVVKLLVSVSVPVTRAAPTQ